VPDTVPTLGVLKINTIRPPAAREPVHVEAVRPVCAVIWVRRVLYRVRLRNTDVRGFLRKSPVRAEIAGEIRVIAGRAVCAVVAPAR
jgi:hypothetical protein